MKVHPSESDWITESSSIMVISSVVGMKSSLVVVNTEGDSSAVSSFVKEMYALFCSLLGSRGICY